jgi:prophage regulatory protein
MSGLKRRVARVLRRREVEQVTGLSKSTIYSWVGAGTFPKPIRLGGRAVAWTADAIAGWLASRVEGTRPVERRRP